MALHPVFMTVDFRDDAQRIAQVRYRLVEAYDDVTPNFDDVLIAAAAVETALDVLTMDHIDFYTLEIQLGGGGAAANDAASNGEYAFIRTTITGAPQETGFVKVPAWDKALYEEAKNGVLDAVFGAAAAVLVALLLDPELGLPMEVDYSQSRQRKVFKKGLG